MSSGPVVNEDRRHETRLSTIFLFSWFSRFGLLCLVFSFHPPTTPPLSFFISFYLSKGGSCWRRSGSRSSPRGEPPPPRYGPSRQAAAAPNAAPISGHREPAGVGGRADRDPASAKASAAKKPPDPGPEPERRQTTPGRVYGTRAAPPPAAPRHAAGHPRDLRSPPRQSSSWPDEAGSRGMTHRAGPATEFGARRYQAEDARVPEYAGSQTRNHIGTAHDGQPERENSTSRPAADTHRPAAHGHLQMDTGDITPRDPSSPPPGPTLRGGIPHVQGDNQIIASAPEPTAADITRSRPTPSQDAQVIGRQHGLRAGPEGGRRGVRGETEGETWGCGEGFPYGVPPPT